jgi:molybdate transport system ATP-binding protein
VSHVRGFSSSDTAATLVVIARKRLSREFTLDVSFDAPPGITIVFGESGSGKSTLLRTVAGLTDPEAGHISIGDRRLFNSATAESVPAGERRIGYVFQSLALFPHMSAAANIEYGLAHLPATERSVRARAAADSFHIAHLLSRRPSAISGGERQRVALARSLVTHPSVLLLDEPLTALDHVTASRIIDDLRAWNAAHKIPILYVTHTREEVDALGERVIALEHGKIVSDGTPREVLDAPRRRRLAQAAGFENLLSGTVSDLREPDGVMRVRLADAACEIEVPLGHAAPGDRVRIAIRAGDILLAAEPPRALSARNVLPGKIASLEHRGALVVARVDCGVTFTVHLTPGAERALELAAGKNVWLVLKTHSCHFVEG